MITVNCSVCQRTYQKEGQLDGEGMSSAFCGRCYFIMYKDFLLEDDMGKQELINHIKEDQRITWQGEDKSNHTKEQLAEFDNFVRENIPPEHQVDRR